MYEIWSQPNVSAKLFFYEICPPCGQQNIQFVVKQDNTVCQSYHIKIVQLFHNVLVFISKRKKNKKLQLWQMVIVCQFLRYLCSSILHAPKGVAWKSWHLWQGELVSSLRSDWDQEKDVSHEYGGIGVVRDFCSWQRLFQNFGSNLGIHKAPSGRVIIFSPHSFYSLVVCYMNLEVPHLFL